MGTPVGPCADRGDSRAGQPRLIRRVMRSVAYVANNDVTLLESGSTYLPALLAALGEAKYEIL